MDVRPLAMAAALLMLVAIGLAGAVLLGESARIPAPRREPALIASAHPEPAPIISQRMRSDDADASPPVTPAPPPAPAPPAIAPAPPPAEPAPPTVAREPPAVVHAHRRLEAEPPADLTPPAERHAHRTLRTAPPLAQERDRAELTPPSAAPSSPEPERPRPPAIDHRYDGVLTVAAIDRLRRSLRLSPDQEPYWPPIASLLREVGRRQMAQVDAGQRPTFDLPGDLSSRLYSAAMPLLGTLREDQKAVVRQHARSLGLGSMASFI